MVLRLFVGLARVRQVLRGVLGRRRQIYVADRVVEYRRLWTAAALAIGAILTPLAADAWEIRAGEHRTVIANDLVEFDDPVLLELAGDKTYCYAVAAGLGIPTASPQTFERAELDRVILRHPLRDGPFVVKPAKGTGSGVGVTVGVRTRLQLANAVALAAVHSRRVIIERLVAAETIRLLFLDGEMIHAVRRRGVRVVGDGSSTIASLIAAGRTDGTAGAIDSVVQETIRQQHLTLDDVPQVGDSVVVRWLPAAVSETRELRTIYDDDVTALVGAALVADASRLMTAIGSRFAAVDILTNDPTRSLAESGGVFLEINTTPGLHHHCPSAGDEPCAIAIQVLRRLLAPRLA
jgi:cyanophycin synthetase